MVVAKENTIFRVVYILVTKSNFGAKVQAGLLIIIHKIAQEVGDKK